MGAAVISSDVMFEVITLWKRGVTHLILDAESRDTFLWTEVAVGIFIVQLMSWNLSISLLL